MNDKIPRLHFANLPTPIEPAESLAKHLGLKTLLIKRDDLTGLAGGGNKARKLEFELAGVVKGGYDTVITIGGQQSNHARMTAAAARKLGLDVKLVLGGEEFDEYKGNMLLNKVLDADIRYINGSDEDADLAALMEEWTEELTGEGKKVYALPIGGSTPLGSLGYVYAIKEIREQMGDIEATIILPVGSCGTFAGALLGAKLFMPRATVTGVSISRTKANILDRVRDLTRGSAQLLEEEVFIDENTIRVYDNYHEGYAVPVEAAQAAIRTAARLEGLLLDYIYTGKVMAALFDLTLKGLINKEIPVIFIHTGGLPIVFAGKHTGNDYGKCFKYSVNDIRSIRNK